MNKWKCLVAVGVMVVFLGGCASIFKGSNSKLDATSTPPGADVFVNGVPYGQTPVHLKLKSKECYTIEFKKEGYKTVTRNIGNSVGAGWIILDVICGLVPVVVDAATGSWYHLDQKNVNAIMELKPVMP